MKNNRLVVVMVVVVLGLGALGVWLMTGQKNSSTKNNNTAVTNVPEANATLTMKDFSFSPTEFTAGLSQTIRVKIVNQGTTAHAFTFDRLDFNSGAVDPGQSLIVTFTTPSTPGRYEFHCDQADHKDQGMTGTMVVQ